MYNETTVSVSKTTELSFLSVTRGTYLIHRVQCSMHTENESKKKTLSNFLPALRLYDYSLLGGL